ncbi:MAG: hypothetical protein HYY17_09020 [Planctomycetes bacterium]|nr:hypothetical protein [Planctomycetota bacterium]
MKRAACLLWLLALACAASATAAERPGGAARPPEAGVAWQDTTLDQWCKKHDIQLVVDPKGLYPLKTSHGPITGSPAPEKIVRAYSALLVREVSTYPDAFVRKLRLAKIVLADDLKFDGQKRAAIPDFEHDILHLDPREGNHSKTYQQTVAHHELFHIVDWKDDGELYEDREWKKLNPAGFKYGEGGRFARGADQWQLDDSIEGFLNKYSTSGVEEDKAEIFANLLVRPSVVAARAAKDKVISRKVERMKKLLHAYCAAFDETFWKSLER